MKFACVCVCLLLTCGAAANTVGGIRDFKLVPKKALDNYKIVKVASSAGLLDVENFKSRDNVIVCEENGSVILHSSKLDTASRTGGTMFSGASNTKENKNKWYEFNGGTRTTVLGPRIPISGCLNSQHGDGGSLVLNIGFTLGGTSSADFGYAIDYGGNWKANLDYMLSVETTLTIIGAYTCTVPANSTGQVFMQAHFVEIEDCKVRELNVEHSRSWKNPTTKKPRNVEATDWRTHPKVRVNSLSTKPIFTCISDPRYLACGAKIPGYGDTIS